MLPWFPICGHYNYTKSISLYSVWTFCRTFIQVSSKLYEELPLNPLQQIPGVSWLISWLSDPTKFVNVTKSTVPCGFCHLLKKYLMENFIFGKCKLWWSVGNSNVIFLMFWYIFRLNLKVYALVPWGSVISNVSQKLQNAWVTSFFNTILFEILSVSVIFPLLLTFFDH